MTTVIGPHIIGPLSHMLDTLQQWQPKVVLVMDPTKDGIRDLRGRLPNATIIGRIYIPDAKLEALIRDEGWRAAGSVADDLALSFKMNEMPEINYWQINNEILQESPEDLWELQEFSLELMAIVHRNADDIGSKARAAIGCFGVGQPHLPTDDRMSYWRIFQRSLEVAAEHGHLLLIHAYGAPTMDQPDPRWYLHRFERQVWPNLPSRITDSLRYVYGEYGIDGGVLGSSTAKQGWRLFTNTEGYVSQIVQAEYRLREYPSCLGACLFTCGQFGDDWQSFDIWPEVAKELAKWSQNNPYEEPEPVEPEPVEPGPIGPEPELSLVELARACRWYSEEATRWVQAGDTKWSEKYLVGLLTPRLYELENRLAKIEEQKPAIVDVVDDLLKHETMKYDTRPLSRVTHIAVHHSAAGGMLTPEAVARYHVNGNGWPGIGYHYYIMGDGAIYQTNRLETWSYHVGSANQHTVGICLAGNFMEQAPPPAQVAAGRALIAWLRRELGIPLENVWGHKDFGPGTACPGDTWDAWRPLLLGEG